MATETNTQIEEIVVSGKGIDETASALAALGAAALGTDERVRRATASWEQLKNRFVEGQQAATGAEKALNALQNAVTAGKAKGDELASVYAGIISRFGSTAVAANITKDSFAALSVKLNDINVSSEVNRLTSSKQAAGLEEVRLKYDSVRREITEYGAEMTRVKGILEAANVPETERVRLLAAVDAALNPAVRAENEMTAALQRQREERAKLLAGYRDEAALARSSAQGQAAINGLLGVRTSVTGSAAASASVFMDAFAQEDAAKKQAVALTALREKYVSLAAAQREYLAELREIKSAGSEVFKTEDERSAAIQRAKDRFASFVTGGVNPAKRATEEHTQAVKLQTYQLVNFGQQLQDIGVSLAGGQNPFMVMVQQVPQMASAVGGVDKIGLAFRSLMTPMVMAATGAAAVGGAVFLVGKQAYDAGEQLKSLRTAMDMVGRGSNTAGLLQGTVNSTVEGSGSNRTEGVAAANVFSQNLNITTEAMKSALVASRDLAEVTGTAMPDAATKLNNALDGGFEALVKFNRENRVLTPIQLEVIRNLQQQGQYTAATTYALTNMAKGLDDLARDHLSPFGKTLAAIRDIYNGVADAASRSLRAMTPQEQLSALQEQLRIAKEYENRPLYMRSVTGSGVGTVQQIEREIERIQAEQAALAELDRQKTEFTRKDNLRVQESQNSEAVGRAGAVGGVSPALRTEEEIRQRAALAKDEVERLKIMGEADVAAKQRSISQKDEIDQLNLQAVAEGRLASVQGQGIVAQMAAERANRLATAAYQDSTRDLTAYAAALSAADAAKIKGMQNGWVKETEREVVAALELAAAWRAGDAEAIKRASNDKEAISLTKQFGFSLEEARHRVEEKNAAMASPEAARALTVLRQQVELQERLSVLEGTGDTVGARKANVTSQMETYRQQNPDAGADDIAAQQALLERQQQAALKVQAYNLKASMDPVAARKKALAELADLEEQHILSEEDIARRRMEINIAYEQGEIDKLEATRTFAGGTEAATRRYALDSSNWATQGSSLINRALRSAEDGFAGFAKGTKTAGEAMADFANVVLMEIERMAAAALLAQSVSPLMNAAFAGIGKFAGSLFGFGDSQSGMVTAESGVTPRPGDLYADGGLIVGPGGPRDDKVPAYLSNGEFVVNAEATAKNYSLLKAINDNQMPRYASGGPVGVAPSSSSSSGFGGVEVRVIDQRTGSSGDAGEGVQTRDGGVGPDGRKIVEVLVTDLVNKALSNGKADKAMSANYGVQRKGVQR